MNAEKALKTLEFDKILDMLKCNVSSERAREIIDGIRPTEIADDARALLSETEEADRILYEQALDPNFAIDNILSSIERARKLSSLSMAELLRISRVLKVSRILKNTMSRSIDAEILKGYSAGLFTNQALEERIDKSIVSDTEMSDDASPALRQIRIKIRRTNDNVKQKLSSYVTQGKYQKYLQDNIVTMRGDRYVIPVKAEFKGAMQGLVHDQSASGQTLFIEPIAVVELNNELKTLLLEEQSEIERILAELTSSVRADSSELLGNYEIIARLDVIFARAKLARSQNAVKPLINDNGYVNIVNGRHPLIDKSKVRPISIYLGKTFDIMLITGPNAGGKTVTLKLVGILEAMGLSGMFIPAGADSEISVFENMFTDIGDEQSIEQSLSTFSGHMTNIVSFINRITPKTLLLLDELGSGTDPSEGSALAVAITKKIKKTGAKAIITSHFNALKEYAVSTDGVGSSCMDFNADTFEPLYKLIIGSTGTSNAIQIAKRLGLKQEIIDDADSMLSEENKSFDKVLMSAEKARKTAEELTEQAKINKIETEKELKRVQDELKKLRENNDRLNEQIRKDTKKLIESSVSEANDIIEEMKNLLDRRDEQALFEARKLKKRLENLSAKYEEGDFDAGFDSNLNFVGGEIKAGDEVYIDTIDKTGKVLSVSKNGEFEVLLGAVRTKVKAKNCKKIAPNKKTPPRINVSKQFSSAPVKSEIILLGKTVDEAVYELDKYLYEASRANLSEVRVVHGKATGALRAGVQKFLKTHPLVEEFRLGKYGEGDSGVTVVKLK
ncbi:MAG: endonuclease MutS2 [Christensenellaceae bacterium]|nr:endonuclease MutS2 [Christensenellaceae bacterium]